MRKWIVSIVLLGLIALSLRSFFCDRIPALASQFLSDAMHVPVQLDKANFYKHYIQIEGFSMKNPRQSVFKNAMSVKTIHVAASYKDYILADPLVIDLIFLENVRINLEISRDNTTACNWNIITENINANDAHWYSNERQALIKRLVLRDVVIGVQLYGKKPQILSPISIIEFTNVDVNHGLPTKEISKIIVDKLVETVFASQVFKQILSLPLQMIIKPFNKNNPQDSCADYKPDPHYKILAEAPHG